MSSNKENDRESGIGSEKEGQGTADTTAGSGGVFGGGTNASGAMGGGGGFGGSTGAGLGGRLGTETAEVGDTPETERGGGTGGSITGSIEDDAAGE